MPNRPRSRIRPSLWRWLGVAVVCAIGFAYIQPVRAYLSAQEDVAANHAERSALLRKQGVLRHRLEQTATDAFIEREARKLGLVRPGERLFIVQGAEGRRGP